MAGSRAGNGAAAGDSPGAEPAGPADREPPPAAAAGIGEGGEEGERERRRTAGLLVLILLVAAVLRVAGIRWGLPGPTHLFSYHPDEYFSLQAALGLLARDPNPHFFNYPSLYLYLAAAASMIGSGGQAVGVQTADLPELLRRFTLSARVMTVLLSLLTITVAYGAASRLADRRAGLWAAIFLAVAPGHVLYSHFAAVDIALALFATLSLYAAIALFDDHRLKTAALGGLASGAAFATKYNGAVALVMPLLPLGWQLWGRHGRAVSVAARAGAVVLLTLVGFCVFSPYVILDWPAAREDIAFEREHMRQGEYPAKAADPNGWFFHLRALGYATGGSAPLALCAALFAVGVWRSSPRSAPLLVFALIWFAIIGATGVRYARYGLPVLPLLAVGVGIGVVSLLGIRQRLLRGLAALAVAVVMLAPLTTAGVLSASMAFGPEPRNAALGGLKELAWPGETIGLCRTVWFDMPPLDYNNGGDALGDLWAEFRRTDYVLRVIPDFDAAALRRERPPVFVETDFQVADWLRAADPKAIGFGQALEEDYELAATFEREWGWWLLGPCGPVPHDWSYPFTTIRVWELKQPEESPADQGT
jgi:4-amino-4-deoxy-L-arabinose transferase-like glycosyltransferase